jgi:hypothetical protein
MVLSWLQVRALLNQATPEFLAMPAAVGAHPDELTPVFGFAILSDAASLGFVSDGQLHLVDVQPGSSYLSTARFCRVCHCTELDCSGCIERTDEPCYWVEADLCSACASLTPAPDAPQPVRKTCLAHVLAPIS